MSFAVSASAACSAAVGARALKVRPPSIRVARRVVSARGESSNPGLRPSDLARSPRRNQQRDGGKCDRARPSLTPPSLPTPQTSRKASRARPLSRGRAVVVRAAGYDDMGNPIGRDTSFGMRDQMLAAKKAREEGTDVDNSFWGKVKAAFKIFFPPSEEETARLEAKKRLRMILVADRCAMSGGAMKDMKARIVEVVSDFVEVDEDLGVEVSMTQDPELQGTMYAVSIPVRQVKPEFDVENETYGWDEEPIYDDDAWEAAKRE